MLPNTARCDFMRVCNGGTLLGAQTTREMHRAFSAGPLPDECRNQAKLDSDVFDLCFAGVFNCNDLNEEMKRRGQRCDAYRARRADEDKGINARVPSGVKGRKQEYVVEIKLDSRQHAFAPLTKQKVVWTAVELERPALQPGGSDADRAMALPDGLFDGGLLFGADSFLALPSRTSLRPDVLFAPSVRTSQGGRLGNGGVVLPGCAVPLLTMRVEWRQTGDECWERAVTVTNIQAQTAYDGMPRQCMMPFSFPELRKRLAETNSRASVKAFIQDNDWGTGGVPFSSAYADLLLECAVPERSMGGKWDGWSFEFGGICVFCIATARPGQTARACNRSNPEDVNEDCCYACASGTRMLVEGFCVARCSAGSTFRSGGCVACGPGLFSPGGTAPCADCRTLIGDPNAWVDARRGCQACGVQMRATANGCQRCDAGQYVARGQTACAYCAAGGHFFDGAECAPCPAGMRGAVGGCVACPSDTFAPLPGATACTDCPIGFRAGGAASACVACPPLNATRMPFAQYFQRGCNLRCQPTVSYVRVSPYVPHGCASCASQSVPLGFTPKADDCTIMVPCTNAPRLNAQYVNASCQWECNAGFRAASDAACVPCLFPPHYSPLRHRPLRGCQFTCLPRVFLDSGLQCNQPCVDLMSAGLPARARNATRMRGTYLRGVCGTTETVPRAEVRFLRLARYGFYSPTSVCGDSLLSIGEECDDGNRVGGDGCSAACRIETNQNYWECDLIGAPCVPLCGWTTHSSDPRGVGLFGYILPACFGGICRCDALSYQYNVEPLSPQERGAWMLAHLVRCDCFGRPMRALPYANCTAENGGCRQCAAGTHYHDDLLGRCAACGSACAPGFERDPKGCTGGNDGCMPCPKVNGVGRYVRECDFACMDETHYCTTTPDETTGVCRVCGLCSAALSQLLQAGPPTAGVFPRGCVHGRGYEWAACDASVRPEGSVWTFPSTTCAWECAPQRYAWRGLCLPCFAYSGGAAPCNVGERLEWCAGGARAICLPCGGPLPGAHQAWVSDPPFFSSCRADCAAGVAYRAQANGTECIPCSAPRCALGERLLPCTPVADAACVPCAPSLPSDLLEFAEAGACHWRCIAGHYADPIDVNGCIPCPPQKQPGFKRTGGCLLPHERLASPIAVPCPALGPNRVWAIHAEEDCATRCAFGFIERDGACVACEAALCGDNRHGLCVGDAATTTLECSACPPPLQTKTPGGECLRAQEPDFTPRSSPSPGASSPSASAVLFSPATTRGGMAHPELVYPSRRLRP